MELGNASDAANLILAALAVCLAVFGTAAWWVAAHPRTVRAFIIRLRRHPRVIRAERRYYNQIEFLVRRFRPEGAFGLSFTIGLAVLAATAWIFGGVLQDVLAHEEIALFDEPIVSYIATHRLAWLTECMEAVTYLGSGAFLAAGVIVGGLALRIRTGSWRPLLLLAYAAAGSGLLGAFLRWAIARPRPAVEWMAVSTTGWGFPSGHTTASTAVYGALAYLVAQTQSDWQGKVRWLTVGALIAFMVGVSRVYLGVHWPTDVIAGWALGTAWLAILFITASTIEQSRSSVALPSSSYARNQLADSAEPDGPPQQPEVKRRTVARGGLTDAEVRLRLAQGEVNTTTERTSRSVGEILRANILTRFNALLGSLFVLMLWIGPPQDALFGGILAVNTLIGVVQELRAKRTLDRLVLLTAPAARVVRAGLSHEIPVDEIVLDDVLELRRGDQIQVDGLVLEATALEVDESLLTGESEPVAKQAGDEVLSGSFVLAGGGLIQTVRVGSKSYSRALATEARKFTLARSEIREGIDRILAYVTWLLVPTAVLLIITQLLETQAGWRDAVASSVGAVVGMVPEGLVLLTSVALAVAVVRLARSHVLIQELPAIELLARVDVVCFDKTGTLTDGRIVFEQLVPAAGFTESAADLREVLAAIAASDPNPNASLVAIAEKFRSPVLQATATVPFSSSRKWSAATFGDRGTWVLGAPEVLLSHIDHSDRIHNEAERIASTGRRVLALSYTSELPGLTTHRTLPDGLTPAALVVLGEQLRSDASATIRYFAEQGLALKVISGDSASTVAAVAAAAGITVAEKAVTVGQFSGSPGALSDAAEKMSVFGRVAPSLKRALIAALRQRGHVVAMVGDGVNDALALKEADIGIAMGTGTAASRAVARLILLEDNFAALPRVVAEGRRAVANVERTANLFLAKTSYVLLMALAVGIAGVEFPFLPRHLSLVGSLTIGIPAFFLALAPNAARARPGFVLRVLRFSVPAGFIAAGATLAAYAITRELAPQDLDVARTAATLTLGACGLSIIAFLTRAPAPWRRPLLVAMGAAMVLVMLIPPLRAFFGLEIPPLGIWFTIGATAGATHFALSGLGRRSTAARSPHHRGPTVNLPDS